MNVDLESLAEATSGAIGSLLSTTILYPLDTCKTKYQAEARSHGNRKYKNLSDVLWEAISNRQILSLYQGLGTKNLQSFFSQFVYFYGYSYFKRLYLEKSGYKSIGTRANLLIAAAAGAVTAITTQPLDTASSRMQTSAFGKSKGLLKTLTEGTWSDAFDGLSISLMLTTNPAIQYTVFDQLKNRVLTNNQNISEKGVSPTSLSAFMAFLLGAISKSIATCLTYPAIRCKVIIQAADADEESSKKLIKSPKTVSSVLYGIWKKEGVLGYFKGLHAQILKTVLSSALLLMIKEKISATTWVLILAIKSAKMSQEIVHQRPLFGGKLSAMFPNRFQDVSNIREVPDHQEVFADPSRDESLIVELLEYKPDIADNGSATWFLQDLASEQDAEGTVVIEQSGVLEAPGLMYNNIPAVVTTAVGQMAISKGRQGREAQNIVKVYLANLRIKGVDTDVLITAYEPIVINPFSESADTVGAGMAVPAAQAGCMSMDEVFKHAVTSFKVYDWSLFVASRP